MNYAVVQRKQLDRNVSQNLVLGFVLLKKNSNQNT